MESVWVTEKLGMCFAWEKNRKKEKIEKNKKGKFKKIMLRKMLKIFYKIKHTANSIKFDIYIFNT